MDLFSSKVYVGTYAKYNDGSIYGKWLDLADYSDKEEFLGACKELHKDEKDPEFMFQDWEDIPEALISEYFISDKWWDLFNETYDEDDDTVDMVLAYFDNVYCGNKLTNFDMHNLVKEAKEAYVCTEDGWENYLEEQIDEYLSSFKGFNRSYFDEEYYEKEIKNDYTFADGFVFNNI